MGEWTAESIRAKLGVSMMVFPWDEPLGERQIAEVREAGITRIEFGSFVGRTHYDHRNKAQVSEITKACREQGVTIASVHCACLPYAFEDEPLREFVAKESAACARVAEEMGAAVYVCHFHNAKCAERTVCDMLEELADCRIKIVTENGPDLQPYVEFVDRIGSERLGIVVDIGHTRDADGANPFTRKGGAREILDLCGPRLWHMHVHEFINGVDHQPPFDGDIEWGELFDALTDVNYEGELIFELMPGSTRDILGTVASFPEEFMRRYGCIRKGEPPTAFLPSPLRSVRIESVSAGQGQINLTVKNAFSEPWQGQIAFNKKAGWQITPDKQEFTLKPGKRVALTFEYQVDSNVPKGRYSQALEISLPGGAPYSSAVSIPVIPIFGIPVLPEGCSLTKMRDWQPPGGPLVLNQKDQLALGKPSDQASLQGMKVWEGPEELSAEAKLGYDEEGLSVYLEVHDAHPGLPETWPGVRGSCVEFFFDFRPKDKGLGNINYDSAVYQVVVRPVVKQGQKPAIWYPSRSSAALSDLSVEAGYLDEENYWVALHIPWSGIGRSLQPGMRMGFDVAVDGPNRNGKGHKTQIIMFGGNKSSIDASGFGVGILGDGPGKEDL